MKPENTYKSRFPKTCKMFSLLIFIVIMEIPGCLHLKAQKEIKTSNDSVYYVYSKEKWNSEVCENVEKIMVILSKDSAPIASEDDNVLVYYMKSADAKEIEPGIKLKPYLMIYKQEVNSPDFLQEEEEEELKIEEWMYKPEYWNVKDTATEGAAPLNNLRF